MKNSLLILFGAVVLSFAACTPSVQTEMEGAKAQIQQQKVPLFIEKENPGVFRIDLDIDSETAQNLKKITLKLAGGSMPDFVQSAQVQWTAAVGQDTLQKQFGNTAMVSDNSIEIIGDETLQEGNHSLAFQFVLKDDARLTQHFAVEKVLLQLGKTQLEIANEQLFDYRPAKVLRAAGQDNCDTYRIPGLITTNTGTLIAVYDNRYNNSKDLQEDIDIGMSRSTDGGQTWEPMRVIMDMGEWGGNPERLNGIGDPCVLYDEKNSTIWVAALWMSGGSEKDMLWWTSRPGMKPTETGQFILTKSTDDGLTWSEPINITDQIKDPDWQLLLQGPGRGISMKNGTLVFPAQFKADIGEKALDGGQYTCHSTIVYSTDGGLNWHIGTGAKTNTTEAQVAELADGTLMLNMRDDRNRKDKSETNGRAVATTSDMGKTWQTHPSSNGALPEPNCMAGFISAEVVSGGENIHALFFSNPDNKQARTNMTIKASLDQGNTWPVEYQVELNEEGGYGYSCLTMVDENTVGILYEGVKDLFFQKVKVNEILKK